MGQLARHFNAFVSKLHSMVSEVSAGAQGVASSAEQLSQLSGRMVKNSENVRVRASNVEQRFFHGVSPQRSEPPIKAARTCLGDPPVTVPVW